MPWFLLICISVAALVLFYVFFLRDWIVRRLLRSQPHAMLEATVAVEDSFWKRSRTILLSRLYWVGGVIIALHDALALSGLDWTPLINQLTWFIPEILRPHALAAFFIVTGWMFEWLRKRTATPLEEKPP